MRQILIRIPWINIPIFGFGAMLFVAFLTCTWLAGRRARREGIAPELVQDLAVWLFVGGLLGARVVYLTMDRRAESVVDFFVQLPRIWDGGIVLYGSVLGGLIAYIGFYWFISGPRHIPTLQLSDIIAPSIALGIAFGRIGCLLNGCCYGQVACPDCVVYPVTFPLSAPPRDALVRKGYQTVAGFTYADDQPRTAVKVGRVVPGSSAEQAGLKPGDLIEAADGLALSGNADAPPTEMLNHHMDAGWERGRNQLTLSVRDVSGHNPRDITFEPRSLGLYPTQIYETTSMVLLFLTLTALYPIRRKQGIVTAVLMMGYAVHRALNELLRSDPRPEGLEKYTSYVLFAAGLALAIYVVLRGRKVDAGTPTEAAKSAEFMPTGATGPA
jgi:phosphatidylglycerol---prolipoprotein diacylglyceryl transferase